MSKVSKATCNAIHVCKVGEGVFINILCQKM